MMRLQILYLIAVQLAVAGVAAFVFPGQDVFAVPFTRKQHSGAVAITAQNSRRYITRLQATEATDATTTDDNNNNKEEDKAPVFSDLLLDAIGYNVTASSVLLSEISRMREMGVNQEETTAFLNNLLASGPDKSLPALWTRSKRMARFSNRARLASLRRTLDITTPPPSESDSISNEENNISEETVEQKLTRRRRALVTLLRSLSTLENDNPKVPAIVALERKAISASKEDQEENLRSRLPEGLETPEYEVIAKIMSSKAAKASDVEIREYKPYSVCAVSMVKPRPDEAIAKKTDAKVQMPDMGGASSFGALAGYLFGKNDKSTAMAMTTPVFTTSSNPSSDRQMEFVLPSDYWNNNDLLTKAPQPLDGSGVTLQQKELGKRAVVMFGGYASRKEVDKRQSQLLVTLTKEFPDWKVDDNSSSQQQQKNDDAPDASAFTLAQYNDPFTVPWKRLNEVSISVVPKE